MEEMRQMNGGQGTKGIHSRLINSVRFYENNQIPFTCFVYFSINGCIGPGQKIYVKGTIQDNDKTLDWGKRGIAQPCWQRFGIVWYHRRKRTFWNQNVKPDSLKIQITYLGYGTIEKIIYVGGETLL